MLLGSPGVISKVCDVGSNRHGLVCTGESGRPRYRPDVSPARDVESDNDIVGSSRGRFRNQISVRRLLFETAVPADARDTPLQVTPLTEAVFRALMFMETPTTSTRFVPVLGVSKRKLYSLRLERR